MTTFQAMIVMGAAAALTATTTIADAAEVRARCVYRNDSTERTKISVDVKDLPRGTYSVTVNDRYVATETVTPPGDEIEAAQRLGISRDTLRYRIEKYQLGKA